MFKYIILLIALILGGVAAYYSVFGLSKLFAGSFIPVLIMAGSIEISKLIAVTTLKRYWDDLKKFTRVYLLIAVIAIMILTSAGIYGFLTSSYQQTLGQKDVNDVMVQNLEFKKDNFTKKLELIESNIDRYNNRIKTLNEIRSSQEVRLDSLYKIRYFTTAKKVENQIEESNQEISKLRNKIDTEILSIGKYNDSIAKYELRIINVATNDVSAELGPLIYISELTGRSMSEVINYFVLLIIFVFDPMAIILLMSFNEIDSKKNKKVIDFNKPPAGVKSNTNITHSNNEHPETKFDFINVPTGSDYSPNYNDIVDWNLDKKEQTTTIENKEDIKSEAKNIGGFIPSRKK